MYIEVQTLVNITQCHDILIKSTVDVTDGLHATVTYRELEQIVQLTKFIHVDSFHYTNTRLVTSSLCRCAEGQGTGSLQHPTVTPALGQWVGLIPNPLQRKSKPFLVC